MSSIVTISIFIFVTLCITIIIFLTSFIISLARKFQTKHKAFEKSTQELHQTHEQNILQSYTEVQERTFEDISRELHDNIGQQLSLANFYMSAMDLSDKEKSLDQMEQLKSIIKKTMDDLSNLNKSVSNQLLVSSGLMSAINRELDLMKNAGKFQVDFKVEGQSSFMNSTSELMLFRIMQELLNNIIKHAQATKVCLKIVFEDQECLLTLQDNGKGIDTSKITSTGLGLQNIQKRIAMLKATYSCIPIANEGTTIQIKIPLYGSE